MLRGEHVDIEAVERDDVFDRQRTEHPRVEATYVAKMRMNDVRSNPLTVLSQPEQLREALGSLYRPLSNSAQPTRHTQAVNVGQTVLVEVFRLFADHMVFDGFGKIVHQFVHPVLRLPQPNRMAMQQLESGNGGHPKPQREKPAYLANSANSERRVAKVATRK